MPITHLDPPTWLFSTGHCSAAAAALDSGARDGVLLGLAKPVHQGASDQPQYVSEHQNTRMWQPSPLQILEIRRVRIFAPAIQATSPAKHCSLRIVAIVLYSASTVASEMSRKLSPSQQHDSYSYDMSYDISHVLCCGKVVGSTDQLP